MKRKKTILIADRNPRVRDLLKRELVALGYLAISVKNKAEVASAMHYSRVDAVIIDPDLPDEDGGSVIKLIQDHDSALPVILLSCNMPDFSIPGHPANMVVVEKGEGSLEMVKDHLGRLWETSVEHIEIL